MSENLSEEKIVEATVINEEKVEKEKNVEKSSTAEAKISVETTTKSNYFLKKLIPIIKSKAFLIGMAILIYTIIVALITVKIDRKIVANNIQKSFQEVFNIDNDSSNKIENKVSKGDKKPKKEAEKLNIGQTITIGDVMELTIESSEWTDEIKPSNTSGFYSYYEDKEGEKYFVIKGKVKNIASEDLDLDYVNQSKIIVNDTYKADVRFEAEESDGTSFYADVKPLQTLNFVAYASLSDEVYNICEKIRCDLDIVNDSAYMNEFFSNNTPHDSFYIEFDNSMNKGSEE